MEDPLDAISSTSSSNNCTICFTEISEDEKITLNCNHYFCNSCIQEWLNKGKDNCPLCRSDIKEYNLNDKNYRLIIIRNTSDRITNREIVEMNRYLSRVLSRVKCLFYIFAIYSSYMTNLYLSVRESYIDLEDKYNSCNNNLTEAKGPHMDIMNVGMYSLDKHSFKACSIPKYFYDKCFMSYNYNE